MTTPRPETPFRDQVAVCIPTYNQAEFLIQAVRSVLAQDHPVHELIISDDASTDDTAAVCARLAAEIPSLRYHRQERNLGIGHNTDFVLRQAVSAYVLRLDSDDRLLPTYLSRLMAVMERAPEAAYAHGDVWEIDEAGRRGRLRTLFRQPGFQPGREALRAALRGYRVAANILLFRRAALVQVGYMTGRGDFAEDYHLTVALARAGYGNVYEAEPLSEYRVWLDQRGVRAARKEQELQGLIRVFEEQIEPGFREAGWPLAPVARARRAYALNHVVALENDRHTPEEKGRLESLLLRLGDSVRLRLVIRLIRARLGFVWRGWLAFVDGLRNFGKKCLRPAPRTPVLF
jgi:hypothetical protein